MALSAFQLSYNGLTFGAGQDVQLASVSGLREAPSTRGSDVLRPRQHGAYAGLTFFGERIVTLELSVSTTTAAFETVLAGVASAFSNIEDPAGLLALQFMLPGWTTARQVVGRVTKGGYPVNSDYSFHKVASIPVEITCPNPLITDTATQSFSVGLPAPSGGRTFPVTFPATFGSSTGSSFTIANGGNENFYPTFTIAGPCNWPTLTTTAGDSLTFELTLGSGDTLVINNGASTATLNGTAARLNTLASGGSFFSVPPGGVTVQFTSADSTSVAATCSGTHTTAAWGWC